MSLVCLPGGREDDRKNLTSYLSSLLLFLASLPKVSTLGPTYLSEPMLCVLYFFRCHISPTHRKTIKSGEHELDLEWRVSSFPPLCITSHPALSGSHYALSLGQTPISSI